MLFSGDTDNLASFLFISRAFRGQCNLDDIRNRHAYPLIPHSQS